MNTQRPFPVFAVSLILALMVAATPTLAQDAVEVQFHQDSKLWVEGTSNRDDWTVSATEMQGMVSLSGTEVKAARLTVPVRQIKSGSSSIMDRLMYGALKADEHPQIVFELQRAEPANDGTRLNTSGRLSIGGETRVVQIPVTVERKANGSLGFKGQYALKMSDYGLTPPTAMFGALRTGDEVVVHFDVQVARP